MLKELMTAKNYNNACFMSKMAFLLILDNNFYCNVKCTALLISFGADIHAVPLIMATTFNIS